MAAHATFLLLVLLAALLLFAAAGDLRSRRIPNWLTITIALFAIPLWLAQDLPLWPDVALRIGVAGGLFMLFALLFNAGMMGGGDVKLIAAVALWLTPIAIFHLLVIMALAGGVLTIVMLVRAKVRRSGTPEVPYGVAIAIGGMWMIAEPIFNHFA